MVFEHRAEHESQWAAIVSIAGKIGCTAQTLLSWVRCHERDSGLREGPTTAEQQRVKALEREVRKANEILKLASAFFAQAELTAASSHEGIHRPAPPHPRGRADLQGAADRPVWLPEARGPAAHADRGAQRSAIEARVVVKWPWAARCRCFVSRPARCVGCFLVPHDSATAQGSSTARRRGNARGCGRRRDLRADCNSSRA